MRNLTATVCFTLAFASASLLAQTNSPGVAQLNERVDRLEKQVQELSELVEPMKEQRAIDTRRKALREKFQKKMSADAAKYTSEQLRDAESLYQVANQKWGTPEAMESLRMMIQKYPDINRTGCATLYVAQKSSGEERAKFLQDCIEKFGDCMYGDGVQVGAYARFLLQGDCEREGDRAKAEALRNELQTQFPDAVDHSGQLLAERLRTDGK